MKTLRHGLLVLLLLFMGGGYVMSQVAFWNGTWAEYAAKVDVPSIQMLSLVLFLALVAFGFWGGQTADE